MGVDEVLFGDRIKTAFSKVKEHMQELEKQLKESQEEIKKQKEEIIALRNELKLLNEQKALKPQNQGLEESSTGNQGVYSFTHSFTKHSLNSYAHKIQDFKQGFEGLFSKLSQQEFLTFLTIYQLQEEKGQVTYSDVAKKLNLSEGCIRTYISSLLKKGIPLIKEKYNNKHIILKISAEFRSLNLKQKLVDMFYQTDPTQKTLSNGF